MPQPGTFGGQGPVLLVPPTTTEGVNAGLNLAWEVDFWGRFRRAIASAEDTLEANCADYNGAMVTLLGDVAKYYVQLRTDQRGSSSSGRMPQSGCRVLETASGATRKARATTWT